jgi:hypothetical protein
VAAAPATSSAQSIGETVEEHVEKELAGKDEDGVKKKEQKSTVASDEKNDKADSDKSSDSKKSDSKKKKKSSAKKPGKMKKKRKKAKKPTPDPDCTSTSCSRTSPKKSKHASSSQQSGATVNGKKVNFLAPGREPPRVIGENFQIDPQVGFGLRGWHTDDYPALSIQTQHYPQWYAGFNAIFFKRIRVFNAFYQSVGLKSPRNNGAVIARAATKAAPGAATKALGMMGYDIKFVLIPMFRYEARSYEAKAVPNEPIRIIPFDASQDDDVAEYALSQDEVYAVSTFETAILGMHYNDRIKGPDGQFVPPKFLPFYFGVGLTQYRKPYQVTVGNSTLDELMFNARFRGAGLALGFDIAGGIDKLGINLAAQGGLGQIQLMQDYSLNEALPDDWFIGYLQGELKVDYTMALLTTRPSLLLSPVASLGGTSFYYIQTSGDSEVGAPLANWDLLWMAMARLIVPL